MNINPRIIGALFVGGGLIVVSYFVAPLVSPKESVDPTVAVVSGKAPAREYIPIDDTDNDGIPNWKEEFRQTEPIQITEDGEAVDAYTPPTTLTDTLAINLLTDTLQAKERGPFGKSQEDILKSAEAQMLDAGQDTFYVESDINISQDISHQALHDYGNVIAEIVLIHALPPETRDELVILQNAVYSEDESILEELTPIIEAYTSMRDDMLSVRVPSLIVKEHLDLLNSYNALLIDIEGMNQAFADPLYTMIRTKRYYDDATGMVTAINNLYTALTRRGITWDEGEMVTQFVTIQ